MRENLNWNLEVGAHRLVPVRGKGPSHTGCWVVDIGVRAAQDAQMKNRGARVLRP